RFPRKNATSSHSIPNPLTGGTTGSTSTFRHCADGAIHSWKGARWRPVLLASLIGPRRRRAPVPVPVLCRRPIPYGDLRNRFDRLSRQLLSCRAAAPASRLPKPVGACKLQTRSTRALVGVLAASFRFSGILRSPEFARAHLSRRLDLRTLRLGRGRLYCPGGLHRLR